MAAKKENIKALFTNTRSRVIILFTISLIMIAVIVGAIKLSGLGTTSNKSTASLREATSIQSIPGSMNPTAQYAALQEKQNLEQAVSASKAGSSAIPTIIRSQSFGEGVQNVGPQQGKGGVGFSTLAQEESAGSQQSLWIQALKDSNCSKSSVSKVINQGASLSDLKNACSCAQLKDNGYKLSDLNQVCSCKDLKAAGMSARQLKDAGFTAGRLRECGFDACELRAAGFSAQEMKDGGFSDGELKGAGFTDNEIARASGLPGDVTAEDVRKAGCQVDALTRLRAQGVTAAAIRRISGCSAAQLKAAGFSARDLKNAGFSAADLKNAGFLIAPLKQGGFNARDLLNAGFSPSELAAAGFTTEDVKTAERQLPPDMTPEQVKAAGCSVQAIKRERLAGVSAALIHQYAGCNAQNLKAAGFTDNDLANAGFTPDQISTALPLVSDEAIEAAACDATKLNALFKQGVSASRIHNLNGCSAKSLKDAGFDEKALMDAGFTPQQLLAAGFNPATRKPVDDATIRAAGCDVEKLHSLFVQGVTAKRIHDLNGCSAEALKNAGYNAKNLVDAGFTPQQLLAAGFTPAQIRSAQPVTDSDIREAGCDPQNLRELFERGASAKRIHDLNGCSANVLKDVGFEARALTDAGFNPQQLTAAGFTPDDISRAQQVNDAAVKAAGCDPSQLQKLFSEGVSASRIHDLNGCSAEALKSAGYSAKDLADAGYSPQQLLAAGFTPSVVSATQPVSDAFIRSSGCDPQKLHALYMQGVSAKRIHDLNGCSAEALKNAGYSAKDLANAGFTPQQLLGVGFTNDQVLATQPPDDAAVKAAGCDPQKLHALFLQGVSATRIHALNGCSAEALKNAGFDAKELADAGFTPEQLLAAGFTPAAVRATVPVNNDIIKAAGCDPQKLHALFLRGVSAKNIHDLNGCSAEALNNAGYGAEALTDAGFTKEQLSAAGFTPNDIQKAQIVNDAAVRTAGCDPIQLHKLYIEGVSAQRIHALNGCSAAALKNAGYNAKDLADAGFTPEQLLAAGFTPGVVNATKPVDDATIKASGCDPQKLQALYIEGVSAKRIHDLNGCSAEALKNAGFNSNELLDAGFTPAQLSKMPIVSDASIRAAKCDPTELKKLFSAGVSAKQIHALNGCSAENLKNAGYSLRDLVDAGFTPQQLFAAGFTPSQVSASQPVDDATIKAAGCDETKLKDLYTKGVSAKRIQDLNSCTAPVLKNAGYDAKQLANAGWTPEQLLAAGFTPEQLMNAALSPSGVIAAGRTADCSVSSLKAAHSLNVSAITIKETLGCSAKQMKEAGYSIDDLKNAGFTAADLKNAGFSIDELKNAGFNAKELAAAGFSTAELKGAGFTKEQLKNAGLNASDLKSMGLTAKQLKAEGYSPEALKNAGYTAEELRAAGFSAKDLKEAGITPDALHRAGFTASELKAAGLTETQLKNAGYTKQDLLNAGFLDKDTSVTGLQGLNQEGVPSTVATIPPLGGVPAGRSAASDNTKELQKILSRQQTQMADQRYQQKVQQRASAMVGAANQAIASWKIVSGQVFVAGSASSEKEKVRDQARELLGGRETSIPRVHEMGAANEVTSRALIKAGDVLFAVLDTSVNSDEPGPILATIVSGKLKGTKLIGSFTRPANADKMVINFATMSVPGAAKTISINAYAIDPNTARTAISSRANHHYLLRYGSLFAATFLEGFGNAFQSANTTITIGGVGGVTNTTVTNGVGRSIMENAVIGLATLGKSWGQVAMQQFSLPTTIDVYSGTGLGILFTQDVTSL